MANKFQQTFVLMALATFGSFIVECAEQYVDPDKMMKFIHLCIKETELSGKVRRSSPNPEASKEYTVIMKERTSLGREVGVFGCWPEIVRSFANLKDLRDLYDDRKEKLLQLKEGVLVPLSLFTGPISSGIAAEYLAKYRSCDITKRENYELRGADTYKTQQPTDSTTQRLQSRIQLEAEAAARGAQRNLEKAIALARANKSSTKYSY